MMMFLTKHNNVDINSKIMKLHLIDMVEEKKISLTLP